MAVWPRFVHQQSHRSIGFVVSLFEMLVAAPTALAQVSIVDDINPAAEGSGEFVAGALGSKVFFKAEDGSVGGEELYWVDGAALGSVFVQDN